MKLAILVSIYVLGNPNKLCVNAEPVTFIPDLYVLKANNKIVSKVKKNPRGCGGWAGVVVGNKS